MLTIDKAKNVQETRTSYLLAVDRMWSWVTFSDLVEFSRKIPNVWVKILFAYIFSVFFCSFWDSGALCYPEMRLFCIANQPLNPWKGLGSEVYVSKG